jgi:CrcB protein
MNREFVTVALVGLGGAVGSTARYLLSGFIHRLVPPVFPYGTFVVNIFGCLAAGVLIARFEIHALESPAARAFVFVGVLGGFTTFSALASDTFGLVRGSEPLLAIVNSGGQLLAGLIALWGGYFVGSLGSSSS